MQGDRSDWSRRGVLVVISAVIALGAARAAHAQLDSLLESLGVKQKMREWGVDVDADKVVEGATTIFEGLTLEEADEVDMGEKLYPRLLALSGGPYPNRTVQDAMRRLFAPLRAASERSGLPWEITVVNDDTVNAWALPGGKLAINKGLLRYVNSEDELAGVIAHEMGHVTFSHALAEMRNEKFMQGFSGIGREVVSSQTRRLGSAGLLTEEAIEQLSGPMHNLVITGYSRSAEDEADGHIISVFEKTGGEPEQAVNFFRTLLAIIPPGTTETTSLFSTHPGTLERIENILAAAREMSDRKPRRSSKAYAALKVPFPTRHNYRRHG